ncbi:hypothetical protein [Pleionea litopenaei]|uniref:Uncharacterized protein n=1 Tax=Pleionea litopenaei TaxID=3070815 RepID=A0AA51X7L0_9GAMM|nr:hypothetical protein [Pleionea sp. HL-JVS1]WMS87220.1 hypothetical protein Q9312_18605 [Pleionea sp. HL-JVS1]
MTKKDSLCVKVSVGEVSMIWQSGKTLPGGIARSVTRQIVGYECRDYHLP